MDLPHEIHKNGVNGSPLRGDAISRTWERLKPTNHKNKALAGTRTLHKGGEIMPIVSAYEFFRRNGRIYINGNLIEFISYEDYLDYVS